MSIDKTKYNVYLLSSNGDEKFLGYILEDQIGGLESAIQNGTMFISQGLTFVTTQDIIVILRVVTDEKTSLPGYTIKKEDVLNKRNSSGIGFSSL